MMSNMGTQYRFTLEDTNRDGAPVPDVFVVGDKGMTGYEFLDYLCQKSRDFYQAVLDDRRIYREAGYKAGKEEVYKDIVKWWSENGRNPNDTVATLIDEWGLDTSRTFTVTVSFEGIEGDFTVTGVEADSEDEACEKVSNGIRSEFDFSYDGPGDVDDDPFSEQTIYISGVEAEEEED